MIRILLCCAAGMSTSMVVNKMKQAAAAKSIDVDINAVSIDEFESCYSEYDCYLLGPQIKYKLADFKVKADALGKPISVIDPMDYGMMKGDKILADALAMIQ
ncbi:PTS sugar transporter subunit IIB [Vibrio mangrovi]|uniref:Lichenan-specific phosphotransferase enzyme IIB component n=1 Tax=Vibrio mangrovi TaxID=474394 RepID=A0A1Y6J090_9VIBR|nr:PTS sugar transporter subunit IIB [Vibrio mangrovi]MDW6004931.1 PTS sugar transporter subunit IIB [Vibrio mangrovi]SMS01693.1 Lichenan-specific phosphotransferase enzyme IIB component [Vibrio mangrovi]